MIWILLLIFCMPPALGSAAETDGPKFLTIPLASAEVGMHHLLIPGSINTMVSDDVQKEGGGNKRKIGERRTVQVHIWVKATLMQTYTELRGIFFVGEQLDVLYHACMHVPVMRACIHPFHLTCVHLS